MWLFDDATSVLHGVDDVSRNPDATELGSNVDKCTQSTTPIEYVGLRGLLSAVWYVWHEEYTQFLNNITKY